MNDNYQIGYSDGYDDGYTMGLRDGSEGHPLWVHVALALILVSVGFAIAQVVA